MPRYADIENLNLSGLSVFDESLDVLIPLSDVRKALQMLPSADVVPKFEVDKARQKGYEDGKREGAREVLEKLDRFIKSQCIEIKDDRGIKGYITSGVHYAISDFKSRYTERSE